MADTVYHLLATRKNIPSDWINDFNRSGFYRIKFRETKKGERSKEDFMYLWDIWFVVLFTWNETDYPDINKISVTVQAGERREYEIAMSEDFSNSCFQQFKKGYLEGLKSFEVEIKQAIGIFKKSDKNKKEAILKLKDQWRKQILFSGSFYPEKLEIKGKYNALYTMATHLVEEYGLEREAINQGKKIKTESLGEFKKLIDTEKLETFEMIESEFLKPGHTESKKSMAALISALIQREFFLKRLKPNLRRGRTEIRNQFEQQYKINSLREQFKPKDIDRAEVKIWLQRIDSRST